MSTTTVRRTFKKDSVLTNVSSVEFAGTGTEHGISRSGSTAAVVASTTVPTNDATGIYSTTFTDPAPGLTYTVRWKIVPDAGDSAHFFEDTYQGTPAGTAATLALSFSNLYTDVGERAYGTAGLDAAQKVDAKPWVNRGYLMFVGAYDWEFLEPRATLSVSASATESTLPGDFAHLTEGFTFADDTGQGPLTEIQHAEIRAKRSNATLSVTYPQFFSIQPVAQASMAAQSWEVSWYGTPSGALTMHYRYRRNPDEMTADDDSPLGGPDHYMTIRQAAYMIAEQEMGQTNGVELDKYEKIFLPRSIQRDNANKVGVLGPNLDPGVTPRLGDVLSIQRNTVTF